MVVNMNDWLKVNDVVQFTEKHRWFGSLGIVTEIRQCLNDIRYTIGVPIPEKGIAYIFSMDSANECTFIGQAEFLPASVVYDE